MSCNNQPHFLFTKTFICHIILDTDNQPLKLCVERVGWEGCRCVGGARRGDPRQNHFPPRAAQPHPDAGATAPWDGLGGDARASPA